MVLEDNMRQGNQGMSIRRGTSARTDVSTVIVTLYGSGEDATEMHANRKKRDKDGDGIG